MTTNLSRSTTPFLVPPSPSARMPHVFVIPPEEEQQDNPPWCCFDADEPPDNSGDFPSTPDIHFLDVPYLLQQQSQSDPTTPIFCRESIDASGPKVVMPRKLEKKQHPEAVRIIEKEDVRARHRDVREDSDVIEVVKVKRSKEALSDPEEKAKIKRSKTFKARATRALQSIKNVGKSSRKPHVKDLWTSSESMPGIFKGVQEQIRQQQLQQEQERVPALPASQPSLSRRNSRSLSHMFQSAKASRPESPVPAQTASTLPSSVPQMLPSTTSSSLPYLKSTDTAPSVSETLGSIVNNENLERPVSPSLSVKKSNRRFSVRELHKLFSFSSSSPDDPSPPTTTQTAPFPPPRNISIPSTSTSTVSSDYPDVPVEEGVYTAVHFLDLDKADQKLNASHYPHPVSADDDDLPLPQRPRDFSFEMRLDSLHFDSLSFDPEDFDITMNDNVLR